MVVYVYQTDNRPQLDYVKKTSKEEIILIQSQKLNCT